MNNPYVTRTFVSFSGKCPLACKHCYTFDLEKKDENFNISAVVNRIEHDNFDIIYVSQNYENFFNENAGVELCEELYSKYQKDLFIITRRYLSDTAIDKLKKLNRRMNQAGNQLYLSVSICGGPTSFDITENSALCATPFQRLENLRRAHEGYIKTLLTIRPVFPDSIIPTEESIEIIKKASKFVDAVVSSGLIATEEIFRKLGLKKEEYQFIPNGDSDYLADLKSTNLYYFDVESELACIQHSCSSYNIPFFRHSMPALNYLASF